MLFAEGQFFIYKYTIGEKRKKSAPKAPIFYYYMVRVCVICIQGTIWGFFPGEENYQISGNSGEVKFPKNQKLRWGNSQKLKSLGVEK